jgi:hypothetical protein
MASKSLKRFRGRLIFCFIFFAVVKGRFCWGFCKIKRAERGFLVVDCGGFVVKTWLLSACFSGAKIFLFFEIYFLCFRCEQ